MFTGRWRQARCRVAMHADALPHGPEGNHVRFADDAKCRCRALEDSLIAAISSVNYFRSCCLYTPHELLPTVLHVLTLTPMLRFLRREARNVLSAGSCHSFTEIILCMQRLLFRGHFEYAGKTIPHPQIESSQSSANCAASFPYPSTSVHYATEMFSTIESNSFLS